VALNWPHRGPARIRGHQVGSPESSRRRSFDVIKNRIGRQISGDDTPDISSALIWPTQSHAAARMQDTRNHPASERWLNIADRTLQWQTAFETIAGPLERLGMARHTPQLLVTSETNRKEYISHQARHFRSGRDALIRKISTTYHLGFGMDRLPVRLLMR
jgi:hypothetical protein